MDFGAENYRLFSDGNDEALVKIIAEYQNGLVFYLNGFVNNLNTAEMLCEDTFYTLAVKKPRFKGKSSFKTFLYSIARYTAYDYIRKNKNETNEINENLESEYRNPENEYFRNERNRIIHKCLGELKSEYHTVLWLLYFENLSVSDIAVVMKKTKHSVESLLTRARKSLKEKLVKEGITDENT